jgi:hypothetical protein
VLKSRVRVWLHAFRGCAVFQAHVLSAGHHLRLDYHHFIKSCIFRTISNRKEFHDTSVAPISEVRFVAVLVLLKLRSLKVWVTSNVNIFMPVLM